MDKLIEAINTATTDNNLEAIKFGTELKVGSCPYEH
jgi:hypothetical protein